MRLFSFLILLSIPLQGFTCDDSTFSAISLTGNVYNCPTGLILSTTGIQKAGMPHTDPDDDSHTPEPLIINVTGDAIINADIIIDGNHGTTILGDNISSTFGGPGSGGPGAFNGGGIIGNTPEPGTGFSANDGDVGQSDSSLNCASGGGGAGNKTDGKDGSSCFDNVSGTEIGPKGILVGTSPTVVSFAGGFGGGAGGPKLISADFDLGMGGGGGGGLLINATGKIIIGNGVRISARGGNGGKSSYNGGGGGAGSGGNIYLKSNFPIENNGIIDVRGGRGGGTRSSSPRGGKGGDGGDGYIIFDVAGVVEELPNAYIDSSSKSSTSNLKSDISCGTVVAKKSESQNLFFQMMIGFLIVAQAFFLKTTFSNLIRRSSKLS